MRSVSALRSAKDFIADFEFGAASFGGWSGEDNTGEFAAGDPWQGRLVLVFSTDLE
jgi:hypothetical protein